MKGPVANLRSKKAQKATEPTLIEQVGGSLREIVAELKPNLANELKKVREHGESAKYLEIASKLLPIIAALNPKADDFSDCQNMNQIGIKLLKSIGCAEIDIDETMIADAVAANDAFIERLRQIRAQAEGAIQ
jgi:hypothetical protein